MPSGINVGGRVTRRPGVYAHVDFSANAGRRTSVKRLAVIGDFPFLPPRRPTLCTSLRSMLKLGASHPNLTRAAAIIYRPGNDSRIATSGPSEVLLVHAGDSTQAWVDLGSTLRLKAKTWGYMGNRTTYYVDVDTTHPDGTAYTFAFTRDGQVERFGPIVAAPLFTLAYTGTYGFDCTASFSPEHVFSVALSKAGLSASSHSIESAWHGPLTITPSTLPNVGETYSVAVTGINQLTGVTEIEELTWTAGSSASQSTTTSWRHLSSVTITQAVGEGASPSSPTFTLDGLLIQADSEQFPLVGDLLNSLYALSSVLDVDGVSTLAGTTSLRSLDVTSSTSLATPAPFGMAVAACAKALSQSTLVEVEVLAGSSKPTSTNGLLSGGSERAASDGDWASALSSLTRAHQARVLCVLSSSLQAHRALSQHCQHMWGMGRYECQGWTGTPTQTTKEVLKSHAFTCNSPHVSLVVQEASILTLSGQQERISPEWYALMHAAAQCAVGVAVPLTKKRLNVIDVYDGADWSAQDDVEELLALGLTLSTSTPEGLSIERALTTYLSSDDEARTTPSAVEGLAQYILRIRTFLESIIGEPALATTGKRIESQVETETRLAVLQGDGIAGWDEASGVTVEQEGGRWIVGLGIVPIYEVTFIAFMPSVMPVSIHI